MTNLVMEIPNLKIMFHVKHCPGNMQLVIAGGRAPASEWLQNLCGYANVYCADKGAKYALTAGVTPSFVFGDADSTVQETYAQAKSLGAQVARYSSYKDDTDLQLVLMNLPKSNVLATGVWGGRFDHLLSNVYSFLNYKLTNAVQVVLADEQECMLLLSSEEAVELKFAQIDNIEALSLLPLAEKSLVSFTGVEWELQNAELTQVRPYAISNVLAKNSNKCYCKVHSGAVGLYIKWKND